MVRVLLGELDPPTDDSDPEPAAEPQDEELTTCEVCGAGIGPTATWQDLNRLCLESGTQDRTQTRRDGTRVTLLGSPRCPWKPT